MTDFRDTGSMRFETPADAIEYHSSQALETVEDEGARHHLRHLRQYLEAMDDDE